MSAGRSISVASDPADRPNFDVVVRHAWSETRNRVTIPVEDAARWNKLGVDPALCVVAAR